MLVSAWEVEIKRDDMFCGVPATCRGDEVGSAKGVTKAMHSGEALERMHILTSI